ncbi:MAG: ferrous iron transport protein B [Tepidisphaeraceae bacterium]
MPTCCHPVKPTPAADGSLTVALAGNPNSGKTTLFNALTGLRQKVANYPGVTVEKKTGKCKLGDGRRITVIDLPGTYSLISRSPDEVVAMEVLRGIRQDTPPPDVVVVVVDASNLQRNLYLVSQLIELGRPLVVALNMIDIAERRGLHIDAGALSGQLGVPVIPVVGHKHRGIEQLKEAMGEARVAPMPHWTLPTAMKDELVTVGQGLAVLDERCDVGSALRTIPLDSAKAVETAPADVVGSAHPTKAWICAGDPTRRLDRYQAMAERLLIDDRAGDVLPLSQDPKVSALVKGAISRLWAAGIDPIEADIEAHYRWIEGVTEKSAATLEELAAMGVEPDPTAVLSYETPRHRTLTERVDTVLVHKVWGLVIFAAIMTTLFVSIFWLAGPIMDGIKNVIEWTGVRVAAWISPGPLHDLVQDGIFKGVGAVVVFVPQIALLFMFLAILEDSGYLARAAFLMDRILAKVGLHGKSFIPLLSSFACAIPGVMATRTMENRRDRLATILVLPFMSCSARLPVYTLLIGTFFAGRGAFAQAGIMLALYALGILAAVVTALVCKRTLLRGGVSSFILEMPTYKLPQPWQVVRQVVTNSWAFIVNAGTTIFCLSVVLWAMTYYGASSGELARLKAAGAEEKTVAAYRMNHSVAGRLGHAMEPAIRPLGYDWKMGVGLVGAFAAREVFVSTMAITYAAGDGENTADLSAAMRADRRPDGTPVWTGAVAVSLLVWFVLAMQCMSTLVIVRRETGGWRWPIFMLVYMNGLAYIVSFGVYQIAKML